MAFTGIPIVLDEWQDVPGVGEACSIEAARAFGVIPFDGSGQEPQPPTDGLYAWFKADAQPVVADGTAYGTIIDSTSSAFDLNAHGSGGDPRYFSNIINNRPAFVFGLGPAGGDVIFRNPAVPSVVTGYSTGIVVRNRNHNASFPTITLSAVCTAGSECSIRYRTTASDLTYDAVGQGGLFSLPSQSLNTWQILTLTIDFAEGIPRFRNNSNSATNIPQFAGSALNRISLQAFAMTDVPESLHYKKKLSGEELFLLRAYLSQKYAINITP